MHANSMTWQEFHRCFNTVIPTGKEIIIVQGKYGFASSDDDFIGRFIISRVSLEAQQLESSLSNSLSCFVLEKEHFQPLFFFFPRGKLEKLK